MFFYLSPLLLVLPPVSLQWPTEFIRRERPFLGFSSFLSPLEGHLLAFSLILVPFSAKGRKNHYMRSANRLLWELIGEHSLFLTCLLAGSVQIHLKQEHELL